MLQMKQKLLISAMGFMALLLAFAPICLASGNAAPYLRDGVGARSIGLGGAFTAIADDATSTIWNPAGLPATETLDFTLSRAPMAFDSTQNFMAIVKGLGENSSIGFSWINVGVEDFDRYSDNDEFSGNFNYGSNALALSFGHALESFNLGASVRVHSDTVGLDAFDGVTSFGGVDVGMLARSGTSFSYGLAVRNIGGKVLEDSVPVLVDAGVAFHLLKGHRATFACDVEHEIGILDEESPTSVRLGTEYRIARTLAVRGGTRVSQDRQALFVGFGVNVGGLQLDYALKAGERATHSLQKAGETHYVSLSYGY